MPTVGSIHFDPWESLGIVVHFESSSVGVLINPPLLIGCLAAHRDRNQRAKIAVDQGMRLSGRSLLRGNSLKRLECA